VFPTNWSTARKIGFRPSSGTAWWRTIALNPPFAPQQNKIVYDCAVELGIKSVFGGTYCCMEGPAFSTKAESIMHRSFGGR